MSEPILPRIRPEVAALPPYRQGRPAASSAYKLSSNENPFSPLPSVIQAMNEVTGINRYPDASAGVLRARLAGRFGVTSDQIHVGAGSVSLLQQFVLAAAGPGDEVLYAWRSFEAYPGLALVSGAASIQVPLTEDARHDLVAMADAITSQTRVIILCSPNNPTGPAIRQAEFDGFMARVPADCLVLLDEAYIEFVTDPQSVNGLVSRVFEAHPNVVVLRTFSKAFGLAGLRVGYAIGHERVLDAARSTAIPLAVTGAAERAALASLDVEDELYERVAVLVERRDALVAALRQQGWPVPDAQGNFVWLATGSMTDQAVAAFDAAGLVVRAFADEGIRISVGEHESVDKVIQVGQSLVQTFQQTFALLR